MNRFLDPRPPLELHLVSPQSTARSEQRDAKIPADIDKRTTAELINRLKAEGFLTPMGGHETRLSSPVATDEQIVQRHLRYSNPLTSIGHHVGDILRQSPHPLSKSRGLTAEV